MNWQHNNAVIEIDFFYIDKSLCFAPDAGTDAPLSLIGPSLLRLQTATQPEFIHSHSSVPAAISPVKPAKKKERKK